MEEEEDIVVEGLIEGLIGVDEGSVVGVEVLQLLLKLRREGDCVLDWLFVYFIISEWEVS